MMRSRHELEEESHELLEEQVLPFWQLAALGVPDVLPVNASGHCGGWAAGAFATGPCAWQQGLLLAGATRTYLAGLAAQVEALRTALIRLENWADTAAPGATQSYSLFPSEDALAPANEYNGPTLALESSEIAVSEKAKA